MTSDPIRFSDDQIAEVVRAAALAEELVSEFYKMSASQWLRRRYDIKTASGLEPDEMVEGPYAQVIRYQGRPREASPMPMTFDFYAVCLQDPAILSTIEEQKGMKLFPFVLYIIAHELIHIVRFSRFLQNFEATEPERIKEEARVHRITREILEPLGIDGMKTVLDYYGEWHKPFENLKQH
ncbi:MAG: hypothetical protein ACOWWM_18535 [Desulfobacterales bacterium]